MQQVRRLEKHEGPLLKELLLQMYADTPTAYGETLARGQQYTDEEWQQVAVEYASDPGRVAFVAEDSGKACAFVAASVLSKQAIAEAEGSQDGAEADELSDTTILSRMWVAPHNRQQGLGRALIQAVTLWAKAHNQRRVVLGVTEGNEIAKRCYLRAGFVPNALVFPHPWHPDLKVYGMELDL